MSLCKIWKSIIQHDIATLSQECNALGVKGEFPVGMYCCQVLSRDLVHILYWWFGLQDTMS